MYRFKKIKKQYREPDRDKRLWNKPFGCLKSLLDEQELRHGTETEPYALSMPRNEEETPEEAQSLFKEAMSDVIPLDDRKTKVIKQNVSPVNKKICRKDEDLEAIRQLHELTKGKGHFPVKHTSEYIEGLGRGVHKWITEELHKGRFSYQDHLDLHGYCVEDACEEVDDFLRNAIRKGYRCVLIIHGRGKSSPDSPKLKENLCKWLSTGTWRKWVIAYTSAKMEHGGPGATYVLLHNHPNRRKKLKKGQQ